MPLPLGLTKFLIRTRLARFVPRARRLTDGGTEYLRYYSDKVLTAPVDELLDPAMFPNAPGPDVVNLNEPAPRFDSPVSAGRVAADRGGLPSAWGLPALRQTIAESYRKRDGRSVDANEGVLVTHGATGAFAAVLDAFVNPGDRVVLFAPSSPLFAVGAKSRRASIQWVPTRNESGVARFDEPTLANAMRGAKLLAFADPGNPDGAAMSPEDQERIAWLANKHDVLIYLDESFARFRYEGRPSAMASLLGADGRTLSASSLTQGHGLGSVRVGWLAGPRPLVRACALTATMSAPFVPTVCQQVAARCLAADDELFAPVLEQFRERRRYAFDQLKAMGLEPTWPVGGFFCWLPVTQFGVDGKTFAERLLAEQRVLVGPGVAFGPAGHDYVRVSFATDEGRLREGLGRLASFVARLKGEPVVEAMRVSIPIGEPTLEVPAEPAAPERMPSFSRV